MRTFFDGLFTAPVPSQEEVWREMRGYTGRFENARQDLFGLAMTWRAHGILARDQVVLRERYEWLQGAIEAGEDDDEEDEDDDGEVQDSDGGEEVEEDDLYGP